MTNAAMAGNVAQATSDLKNPRAAAQSHLCLTMGAFGKMDKHNHEIEIGQLVPRRVAAAEYGVSPKTGARWDSMSP
jgi:hypothetical protein